MKTKHIIIGSLFFAGASLLAQTSEKPSEKPVTVRIKKTEIVNGVEKTMDTTYTTNNPSDIKADDGSMNIMEVDSKDAKGVKKMVIINSNDETASNGVTKSTVIAGEGHDIKITEGPNGEKRMIIRSNGPEIILEDKDVKCVNGEKKVVKNIVVKKVGKCNATQEEINNAQEVYHITIIKVVDASESEMELLAKTTGINDNKLGLEKMDFYPNPNTGKFNLRFSLKDKGKTNVRVLNTEGKVIYNENLADFTGTYDKEIDISQNPKGVYFVKVEQGSHSQIKKIVLE